MWGTSSPGDKLTGDFGNEPDATSISDRGLFRLLAGNLSPGVFRLLQHNLPGPDIALSGWTALKNGDMELTMASGAVFHLGATALTRIR